MTNIYIISGPAGVGKSTTSTQLAKQFKQSAYIEGDLLHHMVVGGYLPPWESEASLTLTWENIADLSINFVQARKHVIIDYVAFPEEVETFSQKIYSQVKHVEIKYVVLRVKPEELIRRDASREKDHQMGARCLELAEMFARKKIDQRFVYDTTTIHPTDLNEILLTIRNHSRFIY